MLGSDPGTPRSILLDLLSFIFLLARLFLFTARRTATSRASACISCCCCCCTVADTRHRHSQNNCVETNQDTMLLLKTRNTKFRTVRARDRPGMRHYRKLSTDKDRSNCRARLSRSDNAQKSNAPTAETTTDALSSRVITRLHK